MDALRSLTHRSASQGPCVNLRWLKRRERVFKYAPRIYEELTKNDTNIPYANFIRVSLTVDLGTYVGSYSKLSFDRFPISSWADTHCEPAREASCLERPESRVRSSSRKQRNGRDSRECQHGGYRDARRILHESIGEQGLGQL